MITEFELAECRFRSDLTDHDCKCDSPCLANRSGRVGLIYCYERCPYVDETDCTNIRKPQPRVIGTKPKELGDLVESALSAVGITSERVTKWLGRPCGCKQRKEKLNRLSIWAKRVLSGKTQDAEKHLSSMTEEEK